MLILFIIGFAFYPLLKESFFYRALLDTSINFKAVVVHEAKKGRFYLKRFPLSFSLLILFLMVGKSSNFDYGYKFVPQQRRRHFLNRRHSAAEVATFELLREGKASKIR
ncbi:hypothetical protein T06_12694 [Trichinella sp. T6]|nr:hypothetical protein T06_12694 [Trichinella sp. T6]